MSYREPVDPDTVREALSRLKKDEMKQAVKEGMKEWLDEKYNKLGLWSVRMFWAALLFAGIGALVKLNGWSPK